MILFYSTGVTYKMRLHQLTNAYLVTNHVEEYWLQEKIAMSSIGLIPKHQIHFLLPIDGI